MPLVDASPPGALDGDRPFNNGCRSALEWLICEVRCWRAHTMQARRVGVGGNWGLGETLKSNKRLTNVAGGCSTSWAIRVVEGAQRSALHGQPHCGVVHSALRDKQSVMCVCVCMRACVCECVHRVPRHPARSRQCPSHPVERPYRPE